MNITQSITITLIFRIEEGVGGTVFDVGAGMGKAGAELAAGFEGIEFIRWEIDGLT